MNSRQRSNEDQRSAFGWHFSRLKRSHACNVLFKALHNPQLYRTPWESPIISTYFTCFRWKHCRTKSYPMSSCGKEQKPGESSGCTALTLGSRTVHFPGGGKSMMGTIIRPEYIVGAQGFFRVVNKLQRSRRNSNEGSFTTRLMHAQEGDGNHSSYQTPKETTCWLQPIGIFIYHGRACRKPENRD